MHPRLRLSIIAEDMQPGQQYRTDQPDARTFAQVFPNPRYPEPDDDFVGPGDRAMDWARRHGVLLWENLDPPGLAMEKL